MEWVRVSERKPALGGWYNASVVINGGRVVLPAYYDGDTFWHKNWSEKGGFQVEPTHWMPMPEPPQEGYEE